MDASDMYPKGWHPMNPDWMKADFRFGLKHKFTRTERPPTYHIIDFGISKRFREGERLRVTADIGTDFSAPEYSNPALDLNPFWIDVYCLGNLLRQEFMDVSVINVPQSPDQLTASTGRWSDAKRRVLSL